MAHPGQYQRPGQGRQRTNYDKKAELSVRKDRYDLQIQDMERIGIQDGGLRADAAQNLLYLRFKSIQVGAWLQMLTLLRDDAPYTGLPVLNSEVDSDDDIDVDSGDDD